MGGWACCKMTFFSCPRKQLQTSSLGLEPSLGRLAQIHSRPLRVPGGFRTLFGPGGSMCWWPSAARKHSAGPATQGRRGGAAVGVPTPKEEEIEEKISTCASI